MEGYLEQIAGRSESGKEAKEIFHSQEPIHESGLQDPFETAETEEDSANQASSMETPPSSHPVAAIPSRPGQIQTVNSITHQHNYYIEKHVTRIIARKNHQVVAAPPVPVVSQNDDITLTGNRNRDGVSGMHTGADIKWGAGKGQGEMNLPVPFSAPRPQEASRMNQRDNKEGNKEKQAAAFAPEYIAPPVTGLVDKIPVKQATSSAKLVIGKITVQVIKQEKKALPAQKQKVAPAKPAAIIQKNGKYIFGLGQL